MCEKNKDESVKAFAIKSVKDHYSSLVARSRTIQTSNNEKKADASVTRSAKVKAIGGAEVDALANLKAKIKAKEKEPG